MADDVDALLAAVMAEIHAADQREVRAIAAFELAANRRAAAVLDAALTAGRPVRVRVFNIDGVPDAPPQAMRIAAVASWTGIDEADVADVADAVLAEPANAAAIVPAVPAALPE